MKLGCKLPESHASDAMLASYFDHASLPEPPAVFGHGGLVAEDQWGLLGNDTVGDCVLAGSAHETMILGREGDHNPVFSTESVLSDYSAITGYVHDEPWTDAGTDPRVAAKYRQSTGLLDARGHRHHIGAYLWLEPGNLEQLFHALYVFSVVGACYELPQSAQEQFAEGKPWDVVEGSPILGGHYVPACGRRSGGFVDAVSWGKRVAITPAFYEQFCVAALVYVDASALGTRGVTPEGFNKAQLLEDLPQVTRLLNAPVDHYSVPVAA